MGGGSGGRLGALDLAQLESKAKKSLKDASSGDPHIFISFSHEDLAEINLLRGQAKNDNNDLEFDDYSVKEPFDSENSDYIRKKIREKIEHCSVTVVYLTKDSAKSDWVNWEIQESIKQGKGVIGMYKGDAQPDNVPKEFGDNGCKLVKWSHEELTNAIDAARKNC